MCIQIGSTKEADPIGPCFHMLQPHRTKVGKWQLPEISRSRAQARTLLAFDLERFGGGSMRVAPDIALDCNKRSSSNRNQEEPIEP